MTAYDDVNPIVSSQVLGFPLQTNDPFLFCVHHDDRYPAGNGRLTWGGGAIWQR